MTVLRSTRNPIILPDNVKPSRPDFEVHYVMNMLLPNVRTISAAS